METIPNSRPILGINPATVVAHGNRHVLILQGCFNPHMAALSVVFDRVVEQVGKHLAHARAVAGNANFWRTIHCNRDLFLLSLIHISEPTRLLSISYAVFCLKK